MNPLSATIVALATPPGRAALGIIRLSGQDTLRIISHLTRKTFATTKKLAPRRLYSCLIYDHNQKPLDRVLLTLFSAPNSYTGEDAAEIYFHGNPVIARQILNTAIFFGARAAYGGEFTYRAVLNNKMDLNQAEAVYNLIHSPTKNLLPAALETLSGKFSSIIAETADKLRNLFGEVEARINYPEDGIEPLQLNNWRKILGNIYRQILNLIYRAEQGQIQMTTPQIFIVGKQNVGKSSLFNCLLAEETALVSPEPGTTRDVISRLCAWQGFTFSIADTAGMFADKSSNIDKRAIELTRKKIRTATGLIFVLDNSKSLRQSESKFIQQISCPAIIVINKIDLPPARGIKQVAKSISNRRKFPLVYTSALQNQGIDKLRKTIYHYFSRTAATTDILLIGENVYQMLKTIRKKIAELRKKLSPGNLELISFLLEEILNELEIVAGKTDREDILQRIFTRFCVGK